MIIRCIVQLDHVSQGAVEGDASLVVFNINTNTTILGSRRPIPRLNNEPDCIHNTPIVAIHISIGTP